MNFRPGFYFKLLCLLIVILGGGSLYSQVSLNNKAKSMLYHNLDEVQRSQKAYGDFLAIEGNLSLLNNYLLLGKKELAVNVSNQLNYRVRSLQKEIRMWKLAIEADLQSAEFDDVESEQEELEELEELIAELRVFYQNMEQYIAMLHHQDYASLAEPKLFIAFTKVHDEHIEIKDLFRDQVRSATAESYLELDEFESYVKQSTNLSMILLASVSLLSFILYFFEHRLSHVPVKRLRDFIHQLKVKRNEPLELAPFGVKYAMLQDDAMALGKAHIEQYSELESSIDQLQSLKDKLSDSEMVNHSILNSISEGVAKTTITGEILLFNQALVDMLDGFNLSSVRNISSALLFRDANGAEVDLQKEIQATVTRTKPYINQDWLLQTDTRPCPVTVTLANFDSGVLIIIQDRSEVAAKSAQLDLVTQIYDGLSYPLWITDNQWQVQDVNLAVCDAYRSDKLKLVDKEIPWLHQLKTQHTLFEDIERQLIQSGIWRGEVTLMESVMTLTIQRLSDAATSTSYLAVTEHH